MLSNVGSNLQNYNYSTYGFQRRSVSFLGLAFGANKYDEKKTIYDLSNKFERLSSRFYSYLL